MDKAKFETQSFLQDTHQGVADPNPVQPDRLYAINNFDIIRLLAALQVAFHHLIHQLKIDHSGSIISCLYKISVYFPGVQIFFFVSGFLISKSYENNSHLLSYCKNRALRIYPALILCVTLSIISVILSGYYSVIDVPITKFILWFFSQITFPGFYNPEFMRGYGAGVINGPVWTISVELQFYFLIPVIYKLFAGFKKDLNKIIIIMIMIFFMVNYAYSANFGNTMFQKEVWYKLIGMSFLPWFYMFLIGVFFQINFATMYKYLKDKLFYILGIYILICYLLHELFHVNLGNMYTLLLAFVIFSFAYSYRNLSNKLIRHNDISYGMYLYHMPICNLFLYMAWHQNVKYLLLSMLFTCIISSISWVFVEKPSLLLKKYSINPINWKYRLTGR